MTTRSGGYALRPRYILVFRVLGSMLLLAASLKGYQLATGPVPETDLLGSRGFSIGLIECEAAFGLWLWSGWYPRQTRWAAFAWFGVLLAASVGMALSGRRSCTCFGPLQIVPWAMAAFDSAALAALCLCPPASGASAVAQPQSPHMVVALALFPVIGVPGALVLGQGATADVPLVAQPRQFNFGAVTRGGRATGTFVLQNHTHAAVAVAEVEKSCACLDLQLATPYVPAGGTVTGTVRVDLAERPDFTGALEIQLRGRTSSGKPAFVLPVIVSVEGEQ